MDLFSKSIGVLFKKKLTCALEAGFQNKFGIARKIRKTKCILKCNGNQLSESSVIKEISISLKITCSIDQQVFVRRFLTHLDPFYLTFLECFASVGAISEKSF